MKKIPQEVLAIAKKEGYKHCTLQDKQYQGYDVYELHNDGIQYIGYPIFVIYKDGKAKLTYGEESKKILDVIID